MHYRLLSVKPQKDKTLLLVFQNGIEKTYNIRSLYSSYPQMKIFEDNQELFEQVRIDVGENGIIWNDELDLDASGLWEDGIETGIIHEVDINSILGYNLANARNTCNMFQRDLAKLSGIKQSDISDIERGKANPTIKTLKRLADSMNMQLKIEFVPK